MARSEAMKEAQRRYRLKTYNKCLEINRKSKKTNYHKNKNYKNIDNMALSFKLLYGNDYYYSKY